MSAEQLSTIATKATQSISGVSQFHPSNWGQASQEQQQSRQPTWQPTTAEMQQVTLAVIRQ